MELAVAGLALALLIYVGFKAGPLVAVLGAIAGTLLGAGLFSGLGDVLVSIAGTLAQVLNSLGGAL